MMPALPPEILLQIGEYLPCKITYGTRTAFCSGLWDPRKIPCDGTRNDAAKNGHIQCLRYLDDINAELDHWDIFSCQYAARNGNIQCLKYLHASKSNILRHWDTNTCNQAALNGQLECLRFARENGCPWDSYTRAYAKIGKHEGCLKYVMDNGCP